METDFLPINEIARRLHRPHSSVHRDLTNALAKLQRAGLEHEFTRLVILHAAAKPEQRKVQVHPCLEH